MKYRNFNQLAISVAAVLGLVGPGLAFAQDSDDNESDEQAIDEIVVVETGTSLNLAPSQMSKDVQIIDAEQLKAIGEPTLGRALARLPQNFGSLGDTVSYRATSANVGPANGASNVGAAVTINLRGVGNDATLILVNGRRMGESGIQGGLQDISSIPMSFIERIEIVMDGASAIYGADAVGGVVNIITKKSADALTAGVRYTAPVDSGNNEVNLDLTGGTNWGSGSVVVGLSTYNQTSLNRADLGYRDGFSSGEYFSPSSGTVTPLSPYLSPGTAYFNTDETRWQQTDPNNLTPGLGDLAEFTNYGGGEINPEDLAPEVESVSINAFLTQEITERTSLTARFGYTTKDVTRQAGYNSALTSLEAGGPWNPTNGNPAGGTEPEEQRVSVRAFYPALGEKNSRTETDSWSIDVGLDIEMTENWQLQLGASYSESDYDYQSRGWLDLFGAGQRDIFNPWGDGTGSLNDPYSWTDPDGNTVDATVMDFLTRNGNSVAWSKNDNVLIDAKLKGTLFELPAGPVKTILGVEYRDHGLRGNSYRFGGGVNSAGTDQGAMDASQDVAGIFVEAFIPVLKDIPFARELNIQGAFRSEQYTTKGAFGELRTDRNLGDDLDVFNAADGREFSADTWMAGLVWAPIEKVRLKANYNTSFLAPDTVQLFKPFRERDWSVYCGLLATAGGGIYSLLNGLDPNDPYPTNPLAGCYIPSFGADALIPVNPEAFQSTPVIQYTGGNPDLDPQRGESRTVTLEFLATESLTLSATAWRTVYFDKFVDPYSDYFRRPAPGIDLRDVFPDLFTYKDNGDVDTIKSQTVNLDRQVLEGTDYNLTFTPSTSFGEFSIMGRWTVYDKNEARLNGNGDLIVRNNLGIEAPQESGAVQISWDYRGWFAALENSYRDTTYSYDYFLDDQTGMLHKSYWRSNLSVAYAFGDRDGWLDRLSVRAGINNLFDTERESYYVADGVILGRTNTGFDNVFDDPRKQTFYVAFNKEFF